MSVLPRRKPKRLESSDARQLLNLTVQKNGSFGEGIYTDPARKAPTGIRAGRTTASARLLGDVVKLRVAGRKGGAERVRRIAADNVPDAMIRLETVWL